MTDYEKLWKQLAAWILGKLDDLHRDFAWGQGPGHADNEAVEWLMMTEIEPLEEFQRKMKQLHDVD